jgi:hypothetical protein
MIKIRNLIAEQTASLTKHLTEKDREIKELKKEVEYLGKRPLILVG